MARKEKAAKAKTKKWKWSEDMVSSLLVFIKEYKSIKEFEGVDFEADLVSFYEEIRKIMAGSFEGFGPVKLSESSLPLNELDESERKKFHDMIKVEQGDIKKGYDRVKEKIKALRQDYRQAVNKGTRSGSGRIVHDNWDELSAIWVGSPATKAIENACTSRKINENSDNILENLESVWEADEPLLFDNDIQTHEISDNESSEEEQSSSLKRSADVNPTPKFVDNKRKKMEKLLSSKQREMVMINAAKKEIELKTSIAQGLLDSNKNVNSAMSKMADSIHSLGNGLVQGFGLLAQALTHGNQQPPLYPVQGLRHPMMQFPNGMENLQPIQPMQMNQVGQPFSGNGNSN